MVTFLFWNLNGKALDQEVTQLCDTHSVDVLVVAEVIGRQATAIQVKSRETTIQQSLTSKTGKTYVTEHNDFSYRLKFFFRYSSKSISQIEDFYGLSIREISLPNSQSMLLAAVHLTSKLHADNAEQESQTRDIVKRIEAAEEKRGHRRTLVMGDFNMNPFEGGLVNADAFHGVMSKHIAQSKSRTVRKTKRYFFYNPMWGRMGDISEGPPGTYYYKKSTNREVFWNTFDQLLLRPELLPLFKADKLKVITKVGSLSLINKDKVNAKDFSDHLPILIDLS
ncbi:MAG: endonuclease/exonuclease/phosphatase family protein [Cyanobacteria bacterium P01_F01_bin.150]